MPLCSVAKQKQNGDGRVQEIAQKACPSNEDDLAIQVVETTGVTAFLVNLFYRQLRRLMIHSDIR